MSAVSCRLLVGIGSGDLLFTEVRIVVQRASPLRSADPNGAGLGQTEDTRRLFKGCGCRGTRQRIEVPRRDALPTLARGLDQLKAISYEHRAKRLKRWGALTQGREGPGWFLASMLAAVCAGIGGVAGTPDLYYLSASLFAFALLCITPTLWDMYTGK